MPNGEEQFGPPPPDQPTIKVESRDVAPPKIPTDLPREHLELYYRETYDLLRHKLGVSDFFATIISGVVIALAATLMAVAHIIIILIQPFIPALGGAVFQVLDDLRKILDPQFAQIAVAILNELLGTEFTVQHMPQGTDINAHIQRAQEVGFLFHKQLMREFLGGSGISLDAAAGTFQEPTQATGAQEMVTPLSGVSAAARFTGLCINFGAATGVIGTLGGLVPEVHLNELREIGEEVARNLGLGRLQRQALKPIIQILIAEPYKWFLNELARPTQFKLNDVINPFSGAVMKAEVIWRSLAREGYSDDKIKALIELHRRKLSESDVLNLFRAGHFDEQQVCDYFCRLGYTPEDATWKKEADVIKANEPYVQELRAAVVQAFAEGHIDLHEFNGMIDGLPLRKEEKDWIRLAAGYKVRVPRALLTFGELQQAYELGIIDLHEFNQHLAVRGFSDDDQFILQILTLEKLKKIKEHAAAVAARAAAKTKKPTPPATPPETPPAG